MKTFVPPALKIARHKSMFEESAAISAAKDMPSEIVAGFLYLGSAKSAANTAEMQRLGICRYLCCAEEVPFPSHLTVDSIASGEVHVLRIPMKDGVKTNLQDHFATAFRFLREAKRAGDPALVFCREGKSRSASITIAYLMRYAAMKYEEAIAVVRSRRGVVDPNVGFCTQLTEFSVAMEAERRGGPGDQAPGAPETHGDGQHGCLATRLHNGAGHTERGRSVKIVEVDSDSSLLHTVHSQPASDCHTPLRGDAETELPRRSEVSPKLLSSLRTTALTKRFNGGEYDKRSSIQGSASAYDLRETLLAQIDRPLHESSNALGVSVLGLSLRSPSVRESESELASPAAALSRSHSVGGQSHDGSHDPEDDGADDDLLPLLDESEMTIMLLSTPGSPNQHSPAFPRASGSDEQEEAAVKTT